LTRSRWLVVVPLVACCLVGGCGGDDDGGAAATTVATGAATSTGGGATSTTGAASTTAGFSGVLVEAKVTSRRVRVDLGQKVRVRVEADHAEEVHVHGYDLKADVAPGKPAVIDFTADVPGVFEVELEESGRNLFELQVQ
jgi:heme/copper-type cytochrome/quinol oxidase subunit 2